LIERVLQAGSDDQQRDWLRDKLYNSLTFRQRMRKLAKHAAAKAVKLLLTAKEQWVGDLTAARNGVAHAGNLRQREVDLYDLSRRTAFLIQLVLMNELGLSDEVQLRAVQDDGYLTLKRSEREVAAGIAVPDRALFPKPDVQ
jgi:hypothetical protein